MPWYAVFAPQIRDVVVAILTAIAAMSCGCMSADQKPVPLDANVKVGQHGPANVTPGPAVAGHAEAARPAQ